MVKEMDFSKETEEDVKFQYITPTIQDANWKTEGVPFYQACEIGKLADFGFVDNDLFISKELFEEFKEYGIPEANDLMVTGVGTL